MFWLILAPTILAAAAEDKSFLVTSFDRLRIDGPFVVEVLPGSPLAVAAGDRAALDGLRVRQEGDTLIVSTGTLGWERRMTAAPGAIKITIHVPMLRTVTVNGGAAVRIAEMRGSRIDLGLNGAGSIDVAAIAADDLNVALSGSGAMTLAGTAERTRVRSFGAGSIAAEGLSAGEAALFADSSGTLRMRVSRSAQVSARGTGAVTVLGGAKCRVTGAGPVDCANR